MIDRFGSWYGDYPGQQPWQDPAYVRMYGQQQPANGQQGQNGSHQQMLTPPTIRAEIIQIDTLDAMNQHPVAPGASQMFMTKDEKHIAVRSMLANGQYTDDIWDKRPPAPPAPTLNPDDYVRRDELADLISQAMQQTPRKTSTKKEETE